MCVYEMRSLSNFGVEGVRWLRKEFRSHALQLFQGFPLNYGFRRHMRHVDGLHGNNSWDWPSLKVILRLNNNVLCHRRGVVDSVTVQIFKRDVNKVGG